MSTPDRKDPVKRVFVVSAVTALLLVIAFLLIDNDYTYDIRFDARARLTEEQLTVHGTTNLADKSIIEYRVTHDSGRRTRGRTTVENGRFDVSLTDEKMEELRRGSAAAGGLGAIEPDELHITLLFEVVLDDRIQEPEIVRRYGGFGGHLGGPHVIESARGKHLEIHVPVDTDAS